MNYVYRSSLVNNSFNVTIPNRRHYLFGTILKTEHTDCGDGNSLQLSLNWFHLLVLFTLTFSPQGWMPSLYEYSTLKIIIEQGGNSNLNCLPRTAVVPISDGGQSAHAWKCVCGGGGVVSQNALQLDYISRCKPPLLHFDNRWADW